MGLACIPLPDIEFPKLPFPLSVSPPELPAIDLSANLCCYNPKFSYHPVLPLSPLVLNPTAMAIISAAVDAIEAYKDAIPLDCPRQ